MCLGVKVRLYDPPKAIIQVQVLIEVAYFVRRGTRDSILTIIYHFELD